MPRLSTVMACAALVAAQGVGLSAVLVFYLVELAVADADDRGRALVTVVLAALSAASLLLVARGLFRRRRWARAPALVVNLLVVPVAVGLVQGGRWYVGVPLLVLAAVVLGLLFAPATSAALEE